MLRKKILICSVQVPFVYGGAEIHTESFRDELVKRGHEVDVMKLPFKGSAPDEGIIKNALMWRLIDISAEDIDIVIATKFPAYLIKHHNKVTWLLHQYRQVYDKYGTVYGEFTDSQKDTRIREIIINMDNTILPESKKIFTASKNVAKRLKKFNNIEGIPLYHPPPHYGRYRCNSYDDYILSVGRLERIKRVDYLIEAMKYTDKRLRCFIVGTGPEKEKLKGLIKKNGLEDRIKLLGFVNDEKLITLYSNCSCVYYAPYDEDYGYVTLEAFLSEKPVITTNDSGGVLEFVENAVNGRVVDPEPREIASAINKLSIDKSKCREFGRGGFKKVKGISWDDVIEKLVSNREFSDTEKKIIIMEDPKTQDFEPYWSDEMAKSLEIWGEGNAWNEIQLLLANCQGMVLDIACGTGKVIEILAKFTDIEVYGCDISDFFIEKAVERGIDRKFLKVCDAVTLDYKDGFFDYAFSIGSLEHFTENGIINCIKECYRTTKKKSFHMVSVSLSNHNEGWLKKEQSFFNNTEQWWLDKFKTVYDTVVVLNSVWRDDISVGKWFICSNTGIEIGKAEKMCN